MDPETDLRPEVIVPARGSSSQQLDLECVGRRKTMPETDKVFAGSIPENYDRYLVPLISRASPGILPNEWLRFRRVAF
jgi:hypothetical protein